MTAIQVLVVLAIIAAALAMGVFLHPLFFLILVLLIVVVFI